MKKKGFVTTYLVTALVVVALVLGGTFIWFHLRTEQLTLGLVHQQAKSLFRQIILTRRWVTQHRGVFVQVRPGVDPNPYLISLPGLKVNIKDESGVQFTLRNPGLVTQEISQLANKSGLYTIHITSLKPINTVTNSPDEFEQAALKQFESGTKEVVKVQQTNHGTIYRYIAPLYYEKNCDQCHGHQGYENGDIRGGISISIPMDKLVADIRVSRWYTVLAFVTVFGVLFLVLYIITRRFLKELNKAQKDLEVLAATDSLTGLANRKTAMTRFNAEISSHSRSGDPLSCLMLDVDHFKSVNDRFGHQVGDTVIMRVGSILSEMTRLYDVVCRYGGEEFMIIMPKTSSETASEVAERIRKEIAEDLIPVTDGDLSIAVSCGVAQLCDREGAEELIGRADAALYQAKTGGRNRVCAAL